MAKRSRYDSPNFQRRIFLTSINLHLKKAIAGVGSDNVINIPIDPDARMDMDVLKEQLIMLAKEKKRAVYEVVAVIGTTEEGAVDRLEEMAKIRDYVQTLGLSFVLHADAAWGGYFASMLVPEGLSDSPKNGDPSYVPHVGLRTDTEVQLRSLKYTDSITIDPHKAGYIPYPAGGLCYRDGRMRYLLTWTAPYLNGSADGESIGVYGVEGRQVKFFMTSLQALTYMQQTRCSTVRCVSCTSSSRSRCRWTRYFTWRSLVHMSPSK